MGQTGRRRRGRSGLPGAALRQKTVKFAAHLVAERGAGRAHERGAIERCTQSHDPEARRQRLPGNVHALNGAADLALDQRAGDGPARMALGNDHPQPGTLAREGRRRYRTPVIHSV